MKLTIGILLLGITCQCTDPKRSEENLAKVTYADRIELVDLNGNVMSLSNYRGKVIILNLWATWCKPCIKELPSMEVLQAKLNTNDFVLLFASDESVEKITRFKQRESFHLNFIRLTSTFEALGVVSLPTTLIIDQSGELLKKEIGIKNWGSETSVEEIKQLAL